MGSRSLFVSAAKLFLITSCLLEFGAECLDNLRIRIESSTFEPCPHMKNGQLIGNNSRIDVNPGQFDTGKYGVARLSRLRLIDTHGSAKEFSLPGCYNVHIDATFTQTIENPYVETYVKTDREEPCRKVIPNPYCPSTDNPGVRALTANQVTCRFCDLCVAPEEVAQRPRKGDDDVQVHVSSKSCNTNSERGRRVQAGQSYPFELTGICTPSSDELERQMTQKFGASWHDVDYIRRGSIIMTIHILDRRNAAPKPCLQLGAGTYKWQGPQQLEGRVMKNLQDTCKRYRNDPPKDDYLGCYNAYVNYAIDRLQ